MSNSFVIKGNICQTMTPEALDLHENAFAVCVDGVSRGVFETLPEEYADLHALLLAWQSKANREILIAK